MNPNGDWVDGAVRKLWNERPGIGVRVVLEEILKQCSQQKSLVDSKNLGRSLSPSLLLTSLGVAPHPSFITRARVKYCLAFVPYRQLSNEAISLNTSQQTLIETKLQERMAFRATRDFDRADQIQHALEAMGVELNDYMKTWKMSKEPPSAELLNENFGPCKKDDSPVGIQNGCKFCNKIFPSRNHVFRHLRDPTSGCGTAIFATGQTIQEPPSTIENRVRKEELQARRGPRISKGRTARHASAENSLWVGDLPFEWTNPRKQFSLLRSIFYQYLPRDVPTPWIKRVIRKGYRKESDGLIYGYAIVVFRDTEEAKRVLELLNQQEVNPFQVLQRNFKKEENEATLNSFPLKVRNAEKSDTIGAAWHNVDDHELDEAGQDPPLIDQLRPLELDELRRRVASLESKFDNPKDAEEMELVEAACRCAIDNQGGEDVLEGVLLRLVKLYSLLPLPRVYVRRQGRKIPSEISEKVLEILETLRWPARNERAGLAAERYLVLQTNVSSDRFYGDLRDACRELMNWADPDYYYSGIAVTKNFVASPHIDHRDQSFQYAVSLGNFGRGGELCVEGLDHTSGSEIVNVVTTHNRIARVDGRHVHYVRTWKEGDRYSLIFYDTSDRHPTSILDLGVDERYLETDD